MTDKRVPGSAYEVDKDGYKWVIKPLTDAARCLMLDMKTPVNFKSKGDAVTWVKETLMKAHPSGREVGFVWLAQDVWERVTRKASRSSSEQRHWVVTMRCGKWNVRNEVFGINEERSAKLYYNEHRAPGRPKVAVPKEKIPA